MIRILILFSLGLLTTSVGTAQSIQDVIDNDVWRPFKKAFDSNNATALMAIHDVNVMRINRDAEYIFVGDEYREALRQSEQRNKEHSAVRSIDFSFTERFHTGDYAFDAGFYRVSYAADGLERITYGAFQAVLHRVDGKWKLLADSDTSNDGSIAEEDFFSGVMLQPSN